MDRWDRFLSQRKKQIDKNVSTAQVGDLIEFIHPGTGLSLWGVYDGDDHVIHFGVGVNMMQRLCDGFLQQMVHNAAGGLLRRTRVRRQRISEMKVPPGTRIKVNNSKHDLWPSPEDLLRHRCGALLHQEFTYDMLNLNSEHFATFVRYGRAASSQMPFKKKNEEHMGATQTFERTVPYLTETET